MNKYIFILGLAAIIAGTFLGYKTTELITQRSSYISTNGVSMRRVVSDCAVWGITIKTEANSIKEAQEKLKKDKQIVMDVLAEEGFTNEEIETAESSIVDNYEYDPYGSASYRDKQVENLKDKCRFTIKDNISIKTQDIGKIKKAKARLGEMMEKNINIGDNVRYFYKDMGKLRIEMINEAAKDSQNRAQNIAESVGAKIKSLRDLYCGNFSIVSDDTSVTKSDDWREGEESIDKRVRVVVHGTFNLES